MSTEIQQIQPRDPRVLRLSLRKYIKEIDDQITAKYKNVLGDTTCVYESYDSGWDLDPARTYIISVMHPVVGYAVYRVVGQVSLNPDMSPKYYVWDNLAAGSVDVSSASEMVDKMETYRREYLRGDYMRLLNVISTQALEVLE